ncbi:hypothetical protein VDGL01_12582 [Verticillium dahliae]
MVRTDWSLGQTAWILATLSVQRCAMGNCFAQTARPRSRRDATRQAWQGNRSPAKQAVRDGSCARSLYFGCGGGAEEERNVREDPRARDSRLTRASIGDQGIIPRIVLAPARPCVLSSRMRIID